MDFKSMSNYEFAKYAKAKMFDENISEEERSAIQKESEKRRDALREAKQELRDTKEEARKLEKAFYAEKKKNEELRDKWKDRAKKLLVCAAIVGTIVAIAIKLNDKNINKDIVNSELNKDPAAQTKITESEITENVEDVIKRVAPNSGISVEGINKKSKKSDKESDKESDKNPLSIDYNTTTGETERTIYEGYETVEFFVEGDSEGNDTPNKNNKVENMDGSVKGITDQTPIPEKPKDESTRADLDKERENSEEKEVTSSTEEPKIPDSLSDYEQIKKDLENAKDNDLEDLVNSTEPEIKEEQLEKKKEIVEQAVEEKQEEVVVYTLEDDEEIEASGDQEIEDIKEDEDFSR